MVPMRDLTKTSKKFYNMLNKSNTHSRSLPYLPGSHIKITKDKIITLLLNN